jgi:hypothetical protein
LEFGENQPHAVRQQELKCRIGQTAHEPVQVPLRRKAGLEDCISQ